MTSPQVRLTQTVQKGGCAAKVAATELRRMLAGVRFPPSDANLLVDSSLFDDAAIYRVSEDLALVQTLDFFTPILDDPRTFGKVAAANALSDVYAMGGQPQTAMAILAFPMASLASEVGSEVLQGACDVLAEARVPLVGGHSIDDETLKFGLSVTGYVHPQKVWSNSRAQVGDVLLLTKALGTGTMTAGLKRSELTELDIQEAVESMTQVNRILDLLTEEEASHIHAATDITGFGLLGHGVQMAKASEKTFDLQMSRIPLFQMSRSCLEKGFLTKAHRTNRQYVEDSVELHELDEISRLLLMDPQTSGGLLLSVARDWAPIILKKIRSRFARASQVGEVRERSVRAVSVS